MSQQFSAIHWLVEGLIERIGEIGCHINNRISKEKRDKLEEELEILKEVLPKLERVMKLNEPVKKPKPRAVNRSAVDGKFVTKKYADRNPDTTSEAYKKLSQFMVANAKELNDEAQSG